MPDSDTINQPKMVSAKCATGYFGMVVLVGGDDRISMTMSAHADTRGIQDGAARLLCEFANTLDVDVDAEQPEAFPDESSLTDWLRQRGLLDYDHRADRGDLALALTFRRGLRRAMIQHSNSSTSYRVEELETAAAALPLHAEFEGTIPCLVPGVGGASGALALLLITVVRAQADGSWCRYKLCVAEDCALAFYDRSKNRSRHWCSMGECGNRQKTRTYRSRQRRN